MFENDCGRFVHQILEDIQAIVDVGEVDFSRMLANLQHIFNSDGRNQTVTWFNILAVAQGEVAVDQLIECRFLIGILPVTDTSFIDAAVCLSYNFV